MKPNEEQGREKQTGGNIAERAGESDDPSELTGDAPSEGGGQDGRDVDGGEEQTNGEKGRPRGRLAGGGRHQVFGRRNRQQDTADSTVSLGP